MNIQKNKVLMKELIWMFDSRNLNKKINKLHERCLRIIYSDITSSFEELLETDIQVSATELHKIVNGLSKGTNVIPSRKIKVGSLFRMKLKM